MSPNTVLNQNEQSVFYHMIRYPTLNDREISEKTGVKTSTVTAIRKRLSNRRMYDTIRVPNFRMLGMELLIVGYGPFPLGDGGMEASCVCTESFTLIPEIFYAASSREAAFFIAAAKNYTSAKTFIDMFLKKMSETGSVDEWNFVFFPFELSAVLNFFDCTNMVERWMKLPPTPKETYYFSSSEPVSMTMRESTVLRKLVENPRLPDVAIATMSGVSRQSVAAMRKKFDRTGLMKTLRVPNFSSMEFEILVMAHTLFNPSVNLSDRKDGIKYLVESVPQFFIASGNYENVLFAASKNYEEFSFFKNEILKLYHKKDYVKRDPRIILMPLSETKIIKSHTYAPIMEKALKNRRI